MSNHSDLVEQALSRIAERAEQANEAMIRAATDKYSDDSEAIRARAALPGLLATQMIDFGGTVLAARNQPMFRKNSAAARLQKLVTKFDMTDEVVDMETMPLLRTAIGTLGGYAVSSAWSISAKIPTEHMHIPLDIKMYITEDVSRDDGSFSEPIQRYDLSIQNRDGVPSAMVYRREPKFYDSPLEEFTIRPDEYYVQPLQVIGYAHGSLQN